MAGVLVTGGEIRMLKLLCNTSTSLDSLVLRLYQNDTTPLETSDAASFTEATFTGYSAATAGSTSWTVTSTGDPAVASCEQKTFTCTATTSQSIYGYYFTTAGSTGVVVAGERFSAAPFTVASSGDQIKVTPSISQD
jgi:hypothetical protein